MVSKLFWCSIGDILRDCFGFAEASLLGMTQENACLKPSLPILRMLVPMLCVGTHRRNALRSKKFGRRAPWLAFTSSVAFGSCPQRTVGTRKQNPKQSEKVPSTHGVHAILRSVLPMLPSNPVAELRRGLLRGFLKEAIKRGFRIEPGLKRQGEHRTVVVVGISQQGLHGF